MVTSPFGLPPTGEFGSLTNWSKLIINPQLQNSSGAIKTDGTLWVWGHNGKGELGQGNTTDVSSPIQVGSLTDWIDASFGHKAVIGTISA